MSFYFQLGQSLNKILISDPITLAELMTRWRGNQLNGRKLDRNEIISLVNQGEIIAYRRLPDIVTDQESTGIICVREPMLDEEDHLGIGQENKNILFSKKSISNFEILNRLKSESDDWGNVFRYDTTLQRTITLEGLVERWAGKNIAGYSLDLEGISQLVRQTDHLPAYILIKQLCITDGCRVCRVSQISYPEMMREVKDGPSPSAVLFNLDDVEKFELDNLSNHKTTNEIREKVNIPPSLFIGKDIFATYAALKDIYSDRRIMAAILQKIGGTKTDIGRLLYIPERYKNDSEREPDDKTYRRTFNQLIKECKANFIITFEEKT